MADEGEKWECPVCMFENLPTNRGTCEFCGEAMPPRADAVEETPAPPPVPVDPPVEDDPVEEPPPAPSTGDELAQLLEEFEAAAGSPKTSSDKPKAPKKAAFRVRGFDVCSEQGKRPSMEDVYVITPSIHDDPSRSYFGVFDGHAGSRAAQYCGQRMLDHITGTAAWQRRDVLAATKFGMARTEQAYLRAALSAQPRWFDGTTAVVVLVVDGILTIGWCGDSRAVLGRKAKGSKTWTAFELSHDHKPTNPREHKRILQLGGMVGRSLKEAQSGKAYQRAGGACPVFCFGANQDSPLRCYPGGLSLSRSIGDVTLKYHPKKVVVGDPEVVQQRISPDDRFILLACDGIWDVMTNERAVAIASKAIRNKEDAARAVVRQAYALGSTDNMTAVVVHLAAGGVAAAE
jgi:serine/threonine protein phosphatase PrpC